MQRNISHQFNHSFNHHFLSLLLSLSHLLTLSSSIHFSLFSSQFWHSHQLLLWWVTPHNHYVQLMMHSAMESKVKKFQKISKINQTSKHTHWETKSKSHQNIPMNLWDSNLSKHTLSLWLPLFLFLSQISEELEWNIIPPKDIISIYQPKERKVRKFCVW